MIKIIIAGIGNVGAEVIASINKTQDYFLSQFGQKVELLAISSRSEKPFEYKWYNDPFEMIAEEDYDVFIELIGGDKLAYDLIKKAIKQDKIIITANKAVIAKYGDELFKLTKQNNSKLYFDASVGGAIPMIKLLQDDLAHNIISNIDAILNGTANFILSQMHDKKEDQEIIIKKAQKLGFAEQDPTLDITGIDAAQKLSILTALTFNQDFSTKDINVTGIENITLDDIYAAEFFDCRIKLLARLKFEDNQLALNISPCFCNRNNEFYNVNNSLNAISVKSNFANKLFLQGHGAGGKETSHAVLADLYAIIKGLNPPFKNKLHNVKKYKSYENEGFFIVKTNEKLQNFSENEFYKRNNYFYTKIEIDKIIEIKENGCLSYFNFNN